MNSIFEDSEATDISPDTDPLAVTPTDNFSLFGGTIDNIEFIIDDNDDEDSIGSKSNPIIIRVANSKSENDQQNIIKGAEIKLTDSASGSECDEKIEDVIETEEPQVQIWDKKTGIETFNVPSNSSVTHGVDKAGLQKDTICYVPNCPASWQNKDKFFWFRPPNDANLRKIWDVCIDRRDRRLGEHDFICHRHFLMQDVIHEFTIRRKDSKEITVPLTKPKLREGAVPCIQFHEECCVPLCERTSGRMYCFPIARSSDVRLWLYMIKNPVLKNLKIKELLRHRVCEVHFEAECFVDDFVLKRTAAPTLYLPVTYAVDLASVKAIPLEEAIKSAQENVYLLCVHGKCNNTSNTSKNVFMFPSDPNRCIAWLKACGREDLITTHIETVQTIRSRSYGVCEDHFDFNSFESTLDKLKADAIPKYHKPPIIEFRESKAFSPQPKTPSASPKVLNTEIKSSSVDPGVKQFVTCFYKNCGFKHSQKAQLFSFPTEKERYDAWLDACGYSNLAPKAKKIISMSQKICSRHFRKEMFESEYKLKEDAIPDDYEKSSFIENIQLISKDLVQRANTTVPKKAPPKGHRMYCAVENCGNFYSSSSGKRMYHKFPDPKTDQERFNIWLSLLANMTLCQYTDNEIYENYMVCFKHFESLFYAKGIKSNPLSQEAVPTMNLTADIQWFFESDYYKNKLQDYFNNLSVEDFPDKRTIEWRKEETVTNTDEIHDKTKCILEEDRIRFPGMGHCLYLGKPIKRKNAVKKTFPYGVYKHFKTGYGLNNDIEIGENVRIHTAIIIDDDDDCERAVLQQLLDKRTIL